MKKNGMSEAAREERRRYQREWARTHRENIRRNAARYWENKARRRLEESEGAHAPDAEQDA